MITPHVSLDPMKAFLSEPQPTSYGLVYAINGKYSDSQLPTILEYQWGRPLNPDLSGIPAHLQALINHIRQTASVNDNQLIEVLDDCVQRFVNRAFTPDNHALNDDDTALIVSLQRYGATHNEVSLNALMSSSHFRRLAKHAYLSRKMQQHYYIYSAILALFTSLAHVTQNLLIKSINRNKNTALYYACLSLHEGNNVIYPKGAGLVAHFKAERKAQIPLIQSDMMPTILAYRDTSLTVTT